MPSQHIQGAATGVPDEGFRPGSQPPRGRSLQAGAVRSLGPGETARIGVDGVSMAPVLRPGDVLTVRRLGRRERPGLGDLVVVDLRDGARGDAGLVVHRLLWRGRETVRTRGDGSGLVDPPVAWGDVLGVVVAVDRQGRDALAAAARRRISWLTCFAAAVRHRIARRRLAATG